MIAPNDFLHFAQSLLYSCTDEVGFRVCIGRAYYSAFHYAKYIAEQPPNSHPFNSNKKSSHQQVIDFYEQSQVNNYQVVAEILKKMKRDRVLADYRLSISIKKNSAELCIKRAEQIFKLI